MFPRLLNAPGFSRPGPEWGGISAALTTQLRVFPTGYKMDPCFTWKWPRRGGAAGRVLYAAVLATRVASIYNPTSRHWSQLEQRPVFQHFDEHWCWNLMLKQQLGHSWHDLMEGAEQEKINGRFCAIVSVILERLLV